jgi:hypothetical protein
MLDAIVLTIGQVVHFVVRPTMFLLPGIALAIVGIVGGAMSVRQARTMWLTTVLACIAGTFIVMIPRITPANNPLHALSWFAMVAGASLTVIDAVYRKSLPAGILAAAFLGSLGLMTLPPQP